MDDRDSVFYVLESGSVYASSSTQGPYSYRPQQLPEHSFSASMPGTSSVFFADSNGRILQSDAWGQPSSVGGRSFEHLHALHAWYGVLYANDGAISSYDKGAWSTLFQLPVEAIQYKMHDSILWFQHGDSVTVRVLTSGARVGRRLPSSDSRVLDATTTMVATLNDSTITIQEDTATWSVNLPGVHHDSDAAIQQSYLLVKGKPSITGRSVVYSLDLATHELNYLSAIFEHGGVVRTVGSNNVVLTADSSVIRSYSVTNGELTRDYSQDGQYFATWAVHPASDSTCDLVLQTTMPELVDRMVTYGFASCTIRPGDRFVRNVKLFPNVEAAEVMQWTAFRADRSLVCVSNKRVVEFSPSDTARQLYTTSSGTIITGALVHDTICIATLDGEFKIVGVDSLQRFNEHEQDDFYTIGMASLRDTILLLQSKFAQPPIRRLRAFVDGAVWPVSYPTTIQPAILKVRDGRVLLIESNLAPPKAQCLFERGTIVQRAFTSEHSTRLDDQSLQSCLDVSNGFLATVFPLAVVSMETGKPSEVWQPPLKEQQESSWILYSVVLDSNTIVAVGRSEYATFEIGQATSVVQPSDTVPFAPTMYCRNGSIFLDEAPTQQPHVQCTTLDGRTFTFDVPPSGLSTSILPKPSCFLRIANVPTASSYFFANEQLFSVGVHR